MYVFNFFANILASLYDGAFIEFTTGLMGVSSLWILINFD